MFPQRSGTVVEIAAAVAAGEMTASDVIGDAIDRLRSADGTLHVVAHAMFETALEQARSADDAVARGDWLGPLHGVPMGLKDL